MTDLVITATSVVADSGATRANGTAGEAITAGQVVYKDSTTKKFKLCDANSATAEARKPAGIALNGAGLNQPIAVATAGDVTIGATLTAGVAYYLSGTAGGICPVADLTTGDYPAILGMATSTTVLSIDIQAPDVAL